MMRTRPFDRYRNCDDLGDWIDSAAPFNTLITLTLKQALPTDSGTFRKITREDCVKTAWLLRDRFTKAVAGRHRAKQVPVAVFVEGDDQMKRFHLHVLVRIPDDTSALCVRASLVRLTETLDWLHQDFDVRPITYSLREVVNYCLKEGFDAFSPNASHFPRN